MKAHNRRIYISIILILLQSIALAILITNKAIPLFTDAEIPLYEFPNTIHFFVNALGMTSIFWIIYIIRSLENEVEFNRKLNYSEEIIEALRGQKHDFFNHLNVIAGMLQLKKTDEALKYIYNICEKTDEIFSVSRIKNVEVSAILHSKCAIAENKGISVELDISSSLEDLRTNSIELSKIMFNLIDNAIFELENCHEEEKILTIDIGEQEDSYIISVGNSYPVLSPQLYDKVFERGYSTKKGDGHGYGLHIVKQIVKKNKGNITVESYEGIGTIFTVFLPKSSIKHRKEQIVKA